MFEHVKGVRDVVSGYAGGRPTGPASSGAEPIGFAEAVRITYDPTQISYEKLLEIFMTVAHDPTQVDRQGPDIGKRYRSAIFPRDRRQREIAERYIARLRASTNGKPIATRLETGGFVVAPGEHQDFVRKHPKTPYVVINDLPKIEHLKERYGQLWKA